MQKIRPLAIYLPQFHPIPENDAWWGKGFTEWTLVKKAKPLLKNHYQPHIPAGLGFYDLRDPAVREMQADIASENGIYGFCYYHYWFNGKRLLNLPVDEILKTKNPDFPFCLAWANEDWTRKWDGATGEILIEQRYNHSDDLKHIEFLLPLFTDYRYIHVDGKPLFIIYRPALFPDIKRTLEIWREAARRHGMGDLYLCYFENEIQGIDPSSLGFDAAIEFQPNWYKLPLPLKRNRIGLFLKSHGYDLNTYYKQMVFDYAKVADIMIEHGKKVRYKRYPGLMPMWDNSARRKNDAAIFINSTPESYGLWLKSVLNSFKPFSRDENFIFINAWNEWAEGNHLEPCEKWGYRYLEKTKQLLTDNFQ